MDNPYSQLISKIDEGTGTQIHLHCFLVEKQLRLQRRICHLLIALLLSIWLLFLFQPLTGRAEPKATPIVPANERDLRPAELPHTDWVYRHYQALP